MRKSATDLYWDERAFSEPNPDLVNIADLSQRTLETDFVMAHLPRCRKLLEVGCGNGLLTATLRERAGFVDAFDYSENMVAQARRLRGETNNRFFHDDVLSPTKLAPPYDAIVCVRVLINLRDLDEQIKAVSNLHANLGDGGILLLVEGYRDGFDALNTLRERCGLAPLRPAAINFYSRFEELLKGIGHLFAVEHEMHTGTYDVLTRVAYPLLVGADNATGHSDFHAKTLPLARALMPNDLRPYARVRGLVLRKCSANRVVAIGGATS